MEAPHPIQIEQVENGYLVHNSFNEEMRYPRRDSGRVYEAAKPRVFQSMAALQEYLAYYFTVRTCDVLLDPNKPTKDA